MGGNWYRQKTMKEEANTCLGCSLDAIFRKKQFIFLALPFEFEFLLAIGLGFEALEEVDLIFFLLSGQFDEMWFVL